MHVKRKVRTGTNGYDEIHPKRFEGEMIEFMLNRRRISNTHLVDDESGAEKLCPEFALQVNAWNEHTLREHYKVRHDFE